jgi:hypothetical protein
VNEDNRNLFTEEDNRLALLTIRAGYRTKVCKEIALQRISEAKREGISVTMRT